MNFTAEQIEDAWMYRGFIYQSQALAFLRKKADAKKSAQKRKELITKIKQIIKLLKRR